MRWPPEMWKTPSQVIMWMFQMASSLEKLETQLEMFTENVRQLGIIVSDFQPQGQNVFNQKM